MLDRIIFAIDAVEVDGAIVLLKWDGQRSNNRYTVAIIKSEADYVWRQDSDDMEQSLHAGLADYKATQSL